MSFYADGTPTSGDNPLKGRSFRFRCGLCGCGVHGGTWQNVDSGDVKGRFLWGAECGCQQKLFDHEQRLLDSGADCRCRQCGQYREPHDYGSGRSRPGLGLCHKCFCQRIDLLTEGIVNDANAYSLIAAQGAENRRQRERILSGPAMYTDEELEAGFAALTGPQLSIGGVK